MEPPSESSDAGLTPFVHPAPHPSLRPEGSMPAVPRSRRRGMGGHRDLLNATGVPLSAPSGLEDGRRKSASGKQIQGASPAAVHDAVNDRRRQA